MIYKNINRFLLLLFILSLYSCQAKNLFEKKEIYSEYNNDIIEKNSFLDINFNESNNENYVDFYNYFYIKNFNNFDSSNNLTNIKSYNNRYENNKPIIPIFFDNKIIIISDKKNLRYYDVEKLTLEKEINLDIEFENDFDYPISFARIDQNIYISYSNGLLISINHNGNIVWKKNFNDISKTPIKIFNNNIILMLTDRLLSLDSINGEINWDFSFKKDEIYILNSNGGEIVNLNHLLFFILPNFNFGEIDTVFGEKNENIISNISLNNSLNNLSKNLHVYNNLLTFSDNDKFINTINIDTNEYLLKNIKIENTISSYFYNNALFTLSEDNFLRAINIENRNIFWKIDFSNYINGNEKIIRVTNFNNNLIILLSNGFLIELASTNGLLLSDKNLKVKDIIYAGSNNDFIYLFDKKNNISFFTQ